MKSHDLAPRFGRGCFLLVLSTLALFLSLPGVSRAQIVINEILAANQSIAPLPEIPDYFPDWVELYNTSPNPINLGSGWSLSVRRNPSTADPTDYFHFPAGTVIDGDSTLLVFFDDETNYPGIHTTFFATVNTPNGPALVQETFTLRGSGDEVLLFNPGKTILVDSNVFGMQIPDYSIGRVPDFSGAFTLTLPTPCGLPSIQCHTNTPARFVPAPAVSNEFTLKINEWVATNSAGADEDWFEIYNPDTNVVTLTGLIFVDRIANLTDATRSRPVPANSYIAPLGFVQIFASDNRDTDAPADEVAFSISSSNGDDLFMYANDKIGVIDRVRSTLISKRDTSEGRVPDGGETIIQLPRLSPEASNFGDITNAVINEVLAHTDAPLEDAIEFHNPSALLVDISHFWLSNNRNNPKKYRIPPGTTIPARGYKVLYEYQFNPDFTGSSPSFTFNSANGDEAWLFSGNSAGRLTGFRTGVTFPASENAVSFGRYITSANEADFVPMRDLTLGTSVRAVDPPDYLRIFRSGGGGSNAQPLIGPLVINEIHYHPEDIVSGTNLLDNSVDEFLEIYNITDSTQLLYDDRTYAVDGLVYADGRTNTWRIRGGVDFEFPRNVSLAAGKFLLVVNFSPTNTSVLNAFRQEFGIDTQVQVFGPYRGKLGNGGASVEILRPDAPQPPGRPDAGLVPYTQVERVRYSDKTPWPTASDEGSFSPDGGGASLQRISSYDYGNDPINWRAKTPTPGRFNTPSGIEAPTIATHPISRAVSAASTVNLTVVARGGGLHYQWFKDEIPLEGQTSALLRLVNVSTNQSGHYQVSVTNLAGAVTSRVAQLIVTASKPDSTRPTVQFVGPATGVNTNPAIVVTGRASDNLGVNSVFYSANGGSFVSATGSVTYSVWGTPFVVALSPGTNSVRAFAVDQAGNTSITNERTFFRSQRIPITLSTTGGGGITGATNQQLLEFGRNFTLTGVPTAGNVFSNWVIRTNLVIAGYSTKAALTYLMASNLSITANFVPNPFRPTAGKYNGLFYDPNDIAHGSSGFFTLTPTDRGTYTASILHDNRKLSGSGQFDLDGKATNVIARTGTNAITVRWSLGLDGSDQVMGTVTDGSWSAELMGDRAFFNKTAPYTNAGKYTFTILGFPGENAPQGHSYGTLAVDASGVVKMSGFLADKTSVRQTVPLSRNGAYPLYVAFLKGSLLSWVAFTDQATSDLQGLLNWHKLPNPKAPFYKNGFNEEAMLLGSRYVAPVGATNRVLHLTNGQLALSGGDLPEDYVNKFILGLANKVTNGGPHRLTVTLTPTTGLFKGSLTPTNTTKAIAFAGAVLQKSTNGFGYALGTNQSSTATLQATP